jgi:fructose-1,6-bisphosphatase/sedoheptulose 1,7-bisphosphatase-like protein
MKHISIDLIRTTEAGALSASRFVGSGDKLGADAAATKSMRERLNEINFAGIIAIGEGKKDKAEGLFEGELVGKYIDRTPSVGSAAEYKILPDHPKLYELAIDVIEGTTQVANGGNEAMSVLCVAEQNCLYRTDSFYMQKMIYGKIVKDKLFKSFGNSNLYPHISKGLEYLIKCIAECDNSSYKNIKVCMLDRPRNQQDIDCMRKLGVKLKLINNCDISSGVTACNNDDITVAWGIGGSPEGVITASAVKCLGGHMEVYTVDHNMKQLSKVLLIEDLVKGPTAFICTGITDGSLLKGVKRINNRYITESLFMRSSSGTVRKILTEHGN